MVLRIDAAKFLGGGVEFGLSVAALAQTLGTQVLSFSPLAAFLASAVIAAAAAVSSLALERRLPEEARLTPQPRSSTATQSAD